MKKISKKVDKLVWNVYHYSFNNKDIEPVNIFNYFIKEFIMSLDRKFKKDKSINLKEELRKEFAYRYWSKYEFEIILTTFPAYVSKAEIDRLVEETKSGKYYSHYVNLERAKKIDVYEQIMLNYDKLYDYVATVMGWKEHKDESNAKNK